jgi:hypothetical protein
MTFYVYPLSEKILLSKSLNAYLDNPRTAEEVKMVKAYIKKAYSVKSAYRFPIHHDDDNSITLEWFINEFCRKFSEEDPYVEQFCSSYNRRRFWDFLARMWIIARYDDQGQAEALRRYQEESAWEELQSDVRSRSFVILNEGDPIIANAEKLVDYICLLSLLINTESYSYYGKAFLLSREYYELQVAELDKHLPLHFFYFGLGSLDYGQERRKNEEARWKFLPYVRADLEKTVQTFDRAFETSIKDKLMYVGSLLKTVAYDITDERTKVVMLVSVIELLLTHDPNYSRFNVEDSINKQFQLKASLLIYLHDRSQNIETIKNRLKKIYELRSNIAHGNFREVEKYLNSLSKKEGEEEYFSTLISDLYYYIRAIISEYLVDPALVEFLKKS